MDSALWLMLQKPTWVFAALFLRVLPIAFLLPPNVAKVVPRKIRIGLVLIVALLLLPPALRNAELPNNGGELIAALACELIFGALLGCVCMLTLLSMQLAGQLIGQLAGINGVDSAEARDELPVVAQLFGWMALILILSSGAHRELVKCVLDSFDALPVGACVFQSGWLHDFQVAVSQSLALGLRLAAPVGLALVMSNILTGLIARSLPQLNTLSVGFSTNLIVMLFAIFMLAGGIGWTYQNELVQWIDQYRQMTSRS
ncbi:MAG: flagellar biosynthetic protein FliR [Planctomycetota bacterium]